MADQSPGPSYWQFVFLGISTLMAWNVYITASEFFRYEFRQLPPQLATTFESIFSIASNITNLLSMGLALYTLPNANHDRRIRNGLLSTALVFATVLSLIIFEIDGWTAFVVSLLALCVAAVSAAFIQCSIYGIAGVFGEHTAEGYMSGQAVAGTIASAIQLSAAVFARGDGTSVSAGGRWIQFRAGVYFGAAAAFVVASVFVWAQVRKHLESRHLDDLSAVHDSLIAPMRQGSPRESRARGGIDRGQSPAEELALSGPEYSLLSDSPTQDHQSVLGSRESSVRIVRATSAEIPSFVIVCCSVMAVTLAVFPPLTEAVVSSPHSRFQISHLTEWHFLVFNVADYLGRVSTKFIKCSSVNKLWIWNIARVAFIPLLLMFPVQPSGGIINSDILFLCSVFGLGWSNGWIATVALVVGTRRAANREVAASLLGFAMCVGLVFGAIASYPVLKLAGL